MVSVIITAIILIVFGAVFLYGTRTDKTGDFFLSKDYGLTLRGLAAIIVVFVHFPVTYANPLQDAVGSFGYVAVTIFFLFSAYGMQYSVEKSQKYLKTFWINRFASLVIPNMVVNLSMAAFIYIFASNSIEISNIFNLNMYVWVLLAYCLLFYIIEMMRYRLRWFGQNTADILLVIIVAAASVLSYIFNPDSKWPYERFGLIWGLLLFRFFGPICSWLNTRRIAKIVIFTLICAIAGGCYLKFKTVWLYGDFLLKIALGLAIVIWIFLCSYRLHIFNRITKALGDMSFEIYLSHGFVMKIIAYFFPGLVSGWFLVATFVACLSFSFLIHKLNRRLVSMVRR